MFHPGETVMKKLTTNVNVDVLQIHDFNSTSNLVTSPFPFLRYFLSPVAIITAVFVNNSSPPNRCK